MWVNNCLACEWLSRPVFPSPESGLEDGSASRLNRPIMLVFKSLQNGLAFYFQ
jgi:hypothetical protein